MDGGGLLNAECKFYWVRVIFSLSIIFIVKGLIKVVELLQL